MRSCVSRIHNWNGQVNRLTGANVSQSAREIWKEIRTLTVVKCFAGDAPLIHARDQRDARYYEGDPRFLPHVLGLALILLSCISGGLGLVLFYRPDNIFCFEGLIATVLIVLSFLFAQWGFAYWT